MISSEKQADNLPVILLITHGVPDSSGIGEIFLREVVQHYPHERIVRYSLVNRREDEGQTTWVSDVKNISRYFPSSHYPIASTATYWWYQFRVLSAMAKEIRQIIEVNQVDVVWVTLNSSFMISLVYQLLGILDVPFVSVVYDVPEYRALNYRYDRFTSSDMFKKFESVLRQSQRVAVGSEGMRVAFQDRYGIDGIPWIHGIAPEYWNREHKSGPVNPKEVVIGFAGSLYAKREWNALIDAIESTDGEVDGRQVHIKFLGKFPSWGARRSSCVEFLGYQSIEATREILKTADIVYLPYWFDKKHAYVVQTSFPNKLSTYVASGVPVLYHGPKESSPSWFMGEYPVGLCCHSLVAEDILRTIILLASDQQMRDMAAHARVQALESTLGQEAMLRTFAVLFGIDYSRLP